MAFAGQTNSRLFQCASEAVWANERGRMIMCADMFRKKGDPEEVGDVSSTRM